MSYQEVKGDLIALAKEGHFDVVAHGCNCLSRMGAGIAPKMAAAFGCDKFDMERCGPTIKKLGNIDYQTFVLGEKAIWSLNDADNKRNEPELTVVNAYTQYSWQKFPGEIPLDYEALTLCLRKINTMFKGKYIGLPMIGCGLAGGDWSRVKNIILRELKDCHVTVVVYSQTN